MEGSRRWTSFRLTTSDVAIHGIDYYRSFEFGMRRVLLGGDGGAVSSRLFGRFAGGLLGFSGSPRSFLFSEVPLQPFGWETHDGYRVSGGREGREGEGGERSGIEKVGE